jgi:epoxyqueuosine reductase
MGETADKTINAIDQVKNPGVKYSGSGTKVFWNNMSTCKSYQDLVWGCNTCMANCTFSHLEDAMIHQVVKATLATTPAFNTFFKKMDVVMGYGTHKIFKAGVGPATGTFNPKGVDWWTTETPPFGWDGRATETHAQ